MFEVEIAPATLKDLRLFKMEEPFLYRRLVTVIRSLAEEPYQGKKLKGVLANRYSLRVGNYRIIYRIFKDRLVVFVIDIGHRREIYR
jgi:mRNA interferase RelE/StbE